MKSLLPFAAAALLLPCIAGAEIVILDGPVAPAKTPAENSTKPGINVPQPEDANKPGDPQKKKTSPELIRFSNRDLLHGSLQAITGEGIVWQSPEAKTPITFETKNVDEVQLGSGGSSDKGADKFSILLNNDDEVLGNIVSLNKDKLVLDTWYAGRLTIARNLVARITPIEAGSGAIYEGPEGPEGWKISNRNDQPGWRFREGAFVSGTSASLGREFKFPPKFNLEFTLRWRGYLQLATTLFSDSPENTGSSGYMLQMNNNYVYLQRMRRNGGSNSMGQSEIPNLMGKSKLRASVRVNQEAKTITLYFNGQMIKQWTDPGEFQGAGKSLVFYSQGQSQMRISEIRLTEWDGKIEEQAKDDKGAENEDTALLANNDKVSGTAEAIADGKLTLVSSYATLNVPLERIRELNLKHEKGEKIKPGDGDVRLHFIDRGQLTIKLEKCEGGELFGTSPSFGKAKFNRNAFSRIQFNLNQQREEEEEEDEDLTEGMEEIGFQGNIINQPIFVERGNVLIQ